MSSKNRLPSAKPVIKNHLLRTVNVRFEQLLQDPRSPINQEWNFGYVMQMLFFGILSGCKTLREVETFSEAYDERIPDTSIDDIITRVEAEPLRNQLAKQVKAALHEHELPKSDFPVRITAIDGKCISISAQDVGEFSQYHDNGTRQYYVNRVLRAFHVSNRTKLFLGQREIQGKSAETSEFRPFVDSLITDYGNTDLLEVLSVDAGMCSKNNADYLQSKGFDYLMALKGPQGVLSANALRLLGCGQQEDCETKESANGKTVTRKFYRCVVPAADKHGWQHLEEFWRINQKTIYNNTGEEEIEERYFLSSIAPTKLTHLQAMQAIRMHWGIENNGNWVFDTAFAEDDAPLSNRAMVLVSLLRLYAYNIISRLMHRRLRRAEARKLSWTSLMQLIHAVLWELKLCPEFITLRSPAFV